MNKIITLKNSNSILFWCPGCNSTHRIVHGPSMWSWNQSYDLPTFSPSILLKYSKLTEKGEKDYEDWVNQGTPKRKEKFESSKEICHSFVTDGKIQFLDDCTHKLKGETVDLPDYPED